MPGPKDDRIARAIASEEPTGAVDQGIALAELRARLFGAETQPRQVGRYVLTRTLGHGGQGIVCSAVDPSLERRVALKLLRPRPEGSEAEGGRLLREAQALARITHRNVVTVHDVGTCEPDSGWLVGSVYIVMEYVEGTTLKTWLRAQSRSVAEILEKFEQAARGLRAAHAHDVVHRDFKPANALVTPEGVVKVLDFGLARGVPTSLAGPSPPNTTAGLLTSTVTGHGTVMGTPAYMAPEQHTGQRAGMSADVYAFCVCLFEALYGRRPFAGDDLQELHDAKLVGLPDPGPRPRGVSRTIRRMITRGLEPDPAMRLQTVDDIIGTLEGIARARRRRPAIVAMLGVGALVVYGASSRSPCTDGADRVATAFDAAGAASIRAAFARIGSSHNADRIIAALEDYARRWQSAYVDACQATHQRQEQSVDLLDRRVACLESRRRGLGALAALLADADAELAGRALDAAAQLPSLQPCSDPAFLEAAVTPPTDPAVARAVDELRQARVTWDAELSAGRYPSSDAVQDAVGTASALGYDPVVAELLHLQGRLRNRLGEYELARESLRRCFFAARRSRHAEVAARCAVELMGSLQRLGRHEDGLEWGRHAAVELAGIGHQTFLRAFWNEQRARLLAAAGDPRGAVEAAEAAVVLARETGGRRGLASALTTLGGQLYPLGHPAEAGAPLAEALEIRLELFDPDHPLLATAHNNLGAVLQDAGRPTDAGAHLRRSVEIREQIFGVEHPQVAGTYTNLALVSLAQDRPGEALEWLRLAEHIHRVRGPAGPLDVSLQLNLASALWRLDLHEPSMQALEGALQSQLAQAGRGHPQTAAVIGRAAGLLPDSVEKQSMLSDAIALLDAAGLENSSLAEALLRRGRLSLTIHDFEAARADLDRALSLADHVSDPEFRPELVEARLEAGRGAASVGRKRGSGG